MRTPQGRILCSVCHGTAPGHSTYVGHAFVPSESETAEERQTNIRELRTPDAEERIYGKKDQGHG